MYESQISALSNSLGVTLESDISVITLSDNINHTYCSKIKWEHDNYNVIGIAQLTMPYSEEISEYWIKYSGPVVIHANLNPHKKNVIASTISSSNGISLNLKKIAGVDTEFDTAKQKLRFKNDSYNYAFIGKVSRFKQVGKTFVVYLEDLGWKFQQKVPQVFRSQYIANQTLDDAFQAICEFIGVEYAYSIEDLSQYNFAADGYSIEKDGQIVENVPTILEEWSNKTEEEEEEEQTDDEQQANALEDNQPFESSGLMEYRNRQQESQQTSQSANQSLNSAITNSTNNQTEDEEGNEQNDTEALNQKIIKFQQEFDDKIKDLFIGNTYYESNISDPIMNYNWITVVPKAPAPTVTENPDDTENQETDENQETGENQQQNEV